MPMAVPLPATTRRTLSACMLLAKASLQNVWVVEHLLLRVREIAFRACGAVVLNTYLATSVADHVNVLAKLRLVVLPFVWAPRPAEKVCELALWPPCACATADQALARLRSEYVVHLRVFPIVGG